MSCAPLAAKLNGNRHSVAGVNIGDFLRCRPQVSTHNLERVRRIKNRMVRLNTRVETIHELLEKLLDDDDDMKDLNLTAKQLVQPLPN